MCARPIAPQKLCPCRGATLTRLLRAALLAALAPGPRYGYALLEGLSALRMFRDKPPDHASVYRALKAMEAEGLLVSQWGASPDGPDRRLFRLTAAGRKCLAAWETTLAEYGAAVLHLLAEVRHGRKALK